MLIQKCLRIFAKNKIMYFPTINPVPFMYRNRYGGLSGGNRRNDDDNNNDDDKIPTWFWIIVGIATIISWGFLTFYKY